MPSSITDPVTGIVIPTPEEQPGPLYAENISDALLVLAHLRHTGVSNQDGYQIPSAGIDFDEDLSAQSNNLIALRSTRYTSQGSPLNGVGDLNCYYVSGGEAWYNDGDGNQVQITENGVVKATALNNFNSTNTSSNYTINSSDPYAVINFNSWSGNRILTLPLASSVSSGRFYFIKDKSGNANTSTNTITIQGSGMDTVDGGASYIVKISYGAVLVMSDGVSNWQLYNFCRPDTLVGTSVNISATGGNVAVSASADINLTATDDFSILATDDGYISAQDSLTLAGLNVTLVGGLVLPTKAVTQASYTVDTTTKDVILYCDSTSNAISINLPAASNGRILYIQDVSGSAATNNITLVRNGSDTIQGLSANYVMDAAFQGIVLAAYLGNSWFIIGTS